MKLLQNKFTWWGIGIVIGALAGYVYYLEVGCNSGSCAITSDPTNSAVYGALMGVILFDGFHKKKAFQKAEEDDNPIDHSS